MSEAKTVLISLMNEAQEIRKEISNINITLERNTVSLEEHIKRTNLAEERLDNLETSQLNCPARKTADAKVYFWSQIRDFSLLIGLAVLVLKEFLPSLKELLRP